MVPLGQSMQTGGNRFVDDWPEAVNISVELVTLQTFQPVTSTTKSVALKNILFMLMTLETSQLPISWLKSIAELRWIQGRVEMCEMRFTCVCVNVRMRSEYIT